MTSGVDRIAPSFTLNRTFLLREDGAEGGWLGFRRAYGGTGVLVGHHRRCVEIPQLGMIRSLNVHVSAAIAMYQYTHQMLTR